MLFQLSQAGAPAPCSFHLIRRCIQQIVCLEPTCPGAQLPDLGELTV